MWGLCSQGPLAVGRGREALMGNVGCALRRGRRRSIAATGVASADSADFDSGGRERLMNSAQTSWWLMDCALGQSHAAERHGVVGTPRVLRSSVRTRAASGGSAEARVAARLRAARTRVMLFVAWAACARRVRRKNSCCA